MFCLKSFRKDLKFCLVMKFIRFWPPFLGAGISIRDYNRDFSLIVVQMKTHFWNKNYVDSHFGGSLYSMTDPFYMLMLLRLLGKNYIVWDKSAKIRYKKPARGTVYARFEITPEQLASIRLQADTEAKVEPVFHIQVTDREGVVVAEIEKTLHVKCKASELQRG